MIKITNVKLSSTYSWNDVKKLMPTWLSVTNGYTDWGQPAQTALVAQQVNIEVDLVENDWAGVSKLYPTWQDAKNNVSTWQGIKEF